MHSYLQVKVQEYNVYSTAFLGYNFLINSFRQTLKTFVFFPDYSCSRLFFSILIFLGELIPLSLPVVSVTLTTQENLLTGFSSPSGLIGLQHPVVLDQYIIPSVTRPLSLAGRPSFSASLYFHFIIILSQKIDVGKQADCKPHRN